MANLNVKVKVAVEGAKKLNNLGSDMSTVGKNLTVGLTLPILGAAAGMTALAADAEKSQAKLDSVFGSMGASAWTSIDALNEHAEALQNSTTFDDESIKEAQAVFLRFGNVTDEAFTQATEAATDLAAFWETDVNTAALQLGKALEAPADGLARLGRAGIIFTDEQKAMVAQMVAVGDTAGAQKLILDEVASQVGNVAEDLAATSGGQMAQAMNQLAEAGESLGTILLPALTALAGALKGIAGWFKSLSPEGQKLVLMFGGLVAAIGPVLFIAGKVIGSFKAIGVAFRVLTLLLLTNPFVALAAAVIALVALIVLNWDKIVAVFKGALKFIGDVGTKLWTPISKGFGAAIDFIRGVWNAFARWWNSIEISVPSFDIPFVGRIGGFSIGLPDLPMLAAGGIVTQPTLALIGESGPEAVVPLSKSGGMGSEIHVHIEGQPDYSMTEERIISTLTRAQFLAGL